MNFVAVGRCVGLRVGLGPLEGLRVTGALVGLTKIVGISVGTDVGIIGSAEGIAVGGVIVGSEEGTEVGNIEGVGGVIVGLEEGTGVGNIEGVGGVIVGLPDGIEVGTVEGLPGITVGKKEGA